jgi:DNA-binding transcriptional MerR regulator
VNDKLLLSVKDAAATLGLSCRSLHRYHSLGILIAVRIGRRKLFRREDLIRFSQQGVSSAAIREHKARGVR